MEKGEKAPPVPRTKTPNTEHEKSTSQFPTSNIIKISYLVSKEEGQGAYQTIQEAINAAKSDSVIKISQGLYTESLIIKNKTLKLEAKDMSSEVYILGSNGPTITVDNPSDLTVTIERVRLTHKGPSEQKTATLIGRGRTKNSSKANQTLLQTSQTKKFTETEMSGTTMGGTTTIGGTTTGGASSKGASEKKNSLESYLGEVCFLMDMTPATACAIMIRRGTVMVRNSVINLNLIRRINQEFVPAIVGLNNCSLVITDCELRGSNFYDTVGVLMRESNILMKNCVITHFKKGGVCLQLKENNTSKIFGSKFLFNETFGIQIIGKTDKSNEKGEEGTKPGPVTEDDEPEIIKDCEIEKNDGPGIQVLCPNSGLIRKNRIQFNRNGIEVICADTRIYDNNITKNMMNGIFVKSINSLYSIPIITGNILSSNRENGILCSGASNIARITHNMDISFNKLCGIKIDTQASPRILRNHVFKNIFQGILIVENSSAHIEENVISENIKANIAFGGESSSNTIITSNRIIKGRCEGIFMIEAGSAYIRKNHISENYDGIIMITSSPEVNDNKISKNKNSGVMIMKDSRPKIYYNEVLENGNIGFFVRDNSKFMRPVEVDEGQEPKPPKLWFYGNLVSGTNVGLVVERFDSDGKEIVANNDFLDCEVRIPYRCKDMRCQLI